MGTDHLHDDRLRDTDAVAKHNAWFDIDPNADINPDTVHPLTNTNSSNTDPHSFAPVADSHTYPNTHSSGSDSNSDPNFNPNS